MTGMILAIRVPTCSRVEHRINMSYWSLKLVLQDSLVTYETSFRVPQAVTRQQAGEAKTLDAPQAAKT